MQFTDQSNTCNKKFDAYVVEYTNDERWDTYLSRELFDSLEEAKDDALLAESCAFGVTCKIFGLTLVSEGETDQEFDEDGELI